ncbi:MAG TPA: N-acetylmuramic acid 6-phosphate etherase [bacterium]|nr:N-acetylmuramic acid 6-phosphate etherase [bacterium]
MNLRDEFGALSTEQRNAKSMQLDTMSTAQILELINDEDGTVAGAVRRALPEIVRATELVGGSIRSGGRVFYVGAGTSGRIGSLDASEWRPTFGTDPDLVQAIMAGGASATVDAASGFEDDAALGARDVTGRGVRRGDVVVGLAASGRTPYAIGALQAARAAGAATVGICCNPDAPMTTVVDVAIVVVVGPEVLTGSTRMKAGTAQKLILNMISTAAMVRGGKVYSNLMVDMAAGNEKLLDRARRIVAEAAGVPVGEAAKVLEAAGNRVKPAIVMAVRGCNFDEAQQRLERAGGFVRKALE